MLDSERVAPTRETVMATKVGLHVGMHRSDESRIASDQSELIVLDHLAAGIGVPTQEVSIGTGLGLHVAQSGESLARHPLIGVEYQDPRVGRQRDPRVPKIGLIRVLLRVLAHDRDDVEMREDLAGSVGRTVVDDDDLVEEIAYLLEQRR